MWLAPFADRVAGRFALPVASLMLSAGMVGAGASSVYLTFTLSLTLASISAGVVDVLVNVRISEAPSFGKPVLLYDIKCAGSQAYLKLASELIQREKSLQSDPED